MASQVYFTDLRTASGEDIFTKLGRLLSQSGFYKFIQENELVALKLHFGEEGTLAFIRPPLVGFVVQEIRRKDALAFLTDTNTVYKGSRSNSVDHLFTALRHGFSPEAVGAPVIISAGLRGQDAFVVEVNLKHFREVRLAIELKDIDKLICLSHLTGHVQTGFGGAIKNLGMGLATKSAKLAMHSLAIPLTVEENCQGCGVCLKHCPGGAIRLEEREGRGRVAVIEPSACLGCGECIGVCPYGAMEIEWNESAQNLQEKICEHAYGVVKSVPVFYLNFLLDITPACDCLDFSDAPIVPDIGILASRDPVAIDQASIDLVNQQSGLPGTALERGLLPGEDKFKALYPEVDYTIQLRYGEQIGLGSRRYELVKVD